MPKQLLSYYKNGNYTVKLYSDGTKVKETLANSFVAAFPDSIDLKITDYCDANCPMCHEASSKSGAHADLNTPFLKTLKKGTELAIGGGNPLSHPDLIDFLERMKNQGVICNLTANERHFLKDRELVLSLMKDKLICGLGISISSYNEEIIELAKLNKNIVLHVINGVFTELEALYGKGLKVLILGYKCFGRGKPFFSEEIRRNMDISKEMLPLALDKFSVLSFDNLALEQLDVKSIISNKLYEKIFMGNDGEGTMYIDLVKGEYALSSTSAVRHKLQNDIITMFKNIQVK